MAGPRIATMNDCHVEINSQNKILVDAGRSLLATLAGEKIFLPTACGGRGLCGLCKVKVLQGGGEVTGQETKRLGQERLGLGWRLACQVTVRSNVSIELDSDVLKKGRFEGTCEDIEDLTHDIRRLRFVLRDPSTIDFVPGQYVQLRCPPYPGSPEEVSREYSIASDPSQKHKIELIMRRVPKGICTTYCFSTLKVGDPVIFSGPHGEFRISETDAPMIFIAGGSGMAPFVSMLHHMANTRSSRRVTLFFGANRPRDLYLLDEMRHFETALPHFRFVPVVIKGDDEQTWTGQTGFVTEAVFRAFQSLAGHEGYVCGPPAMIDAAVQVLAALGIPKDKIFYDRFL
jgi:Na+-transporting NADH:ubiquinone oxidoreductase subunit F